MAYNGLVRLPDIPLCILDTETTGFLPKVNRVIEFACLRVEHGEITDRYEQLIAIPEDIPETVQVLTRIRPDDLRGKPEMDAVRQDILAHIGMDTVIVGQNVGFDLRMLRGEGIDLTDRPWIDTSMLASLVFPELVSYSLGYISKTLGLDHTPVHRAMGDVRATLQLLERCWERLAELPEDLRALTVAILQRSSPGYRAVASALPAATATSSPGWLEFARRKTANPVQTTMTIPLPDRGTVAVMEESLSPDMLDHLVGAAVGTEGVRHWIAVKNLGAAIRRLRLPQSVRVLFPPGHMLNHDAVTAFAAQQRYTADEATLALKLAWYEPQTLDDLPLHGDERAVWNGKLACTATSSSYLEQFKNLPRVVLVDHRQLLEFVTAEDAAHAILREGADHIIVDDASTLEDAATKAYGWFCDLDALRASAEGHDDLTGFLDALSIWVERTRAFRDVHVLTAADLQGREIAHIMSSIARLLQEGNLPAPAHMHLRQLQNILDAHRLPQRIAWIEQRQSGSQFLHSVPESVGALLRERLYNRHRVTLLVPPGSTEQLPEILPQGTPASTVMLDSLRPPIAITFPEDRSLPSVLAQPPPGKTVVLLGSKRLIEEAFIAHTERLERQQVTMICQNLSGGQERMQAEFLAASAPALWLLTPWTYESVELPPGTLHRLMICSIPFDHPSHPVTSRRSERYRNGFSDYTLPRTLQRLFRLVRTAVRHGTPDVQIDICDERIRTKEYGKAIRAYLAGFSRSSAPEPPPSASSHTLRTRKKRTATKASPPEGQMTLL